MIMASRTYTSRRSSITLALVEKLKEINGSGSYTSSLFGNVIPKLEFVSDINNFPSVSVVAGNEIRVYQAAGYKDRYLSMKIIIFVDEENPLTKLDAILEDIETVIEDNSQLVYEDKQGQEQKTIDISLVSINTDEGTLEPIAMAEMELRVHY
jgi:hypothetical protein